jgi:hypothetical protein
MKTTISYKGQAREIEYEILGPSIYVYKNVLPKDWNIIERVNNALNIPGTRFEWKQAQTGFQETTLQSRKCMDFKIGEASLSPRDQYSEDMFKLWEDTIDNLKMVLEHYKPNNYLSEISYFEAINIVRYGKGEYFKTHSDDGDPYRCTVSAVGYVNDDFEGGELTFPIFGLTYKPKAGEMVLFPSAYAYAHASEPITDDGVKYSFVIMMDRNKFANRKDSPTFYSKEYLAKHGLNRQ